MVKLVQRKTFSRELKILEEGNQIYGRLTPLNPFLDSEGFFRVGGRLSHSDLTYSRKHPILLPNNHNLTHLIICNQYLKLLHSATQATLNAIRNNCGPKDRTLFERAVTHTGIDYCGPFFIKEKKHGNRVKVKIYTAIFVCSATKAVHIEIVSDLTTEAFLACLKRFFA